jgi:hypothetical protein
LSGGPEFTKKIKAEAVEAEIGWRTIERVKGQLKIHALKDSESGRWVWTFLGPPKEADDDRSDDVGGLGDLQGDVKAAKEGGDGGDYPTTATTSGNMAYYTREDSQGRQDANGCVHTEIANEDRQYHQSTNEDRQVAHDEVENLKNLYEQEGGE